MTMTIFDRLLPPKRPDAPPPENPVQKALDDYLEMQHMLMIARDDLAERTETVAHLSAECESLKYHVDEQRQFFEAKIADLTRDRDRLARYVQDMRTRFAVIKETIETTERAIHTFSIQEPPSAPRKASLFPAPAEPVDHDDLEMSDAMKALLGTEVKITS